MLQILFAAGIIGAFYYLIKHILNNGKKEDTVKETVKGASKFMLKVLIPILVFMAAVYIFLKISGY